MERTKVDIRKDFKPAPQLKKLYGYYLNIVFFAGFLSWYVPLILFVQEFALAFLFILFFLVYVFVAFIWIPRYYDTVFYSLTESEIVWRRGVWFKTTGIVPYNEHRCDSRTFIKKAEGCFS